MLRIDPALPIDKIDPALPTLKMLPKLRMLPTLPKLRMLNKLLALSGPVRLPLLIGFSPRLERLDLPIIDSSVLSLFAHQPVCRESLTGRYPLGGPAWSGR
jgi:hypothetical protein